MMAMSPRRSRGRPREFDEAQALDGAIALFSATGFSAASIADLQEATGLTGGSLYKAYHDKEGMFAHALQRYVASQEQRISDIIGGSETAATRIMRLIRLYAELSRGAQGRRGCMVVGAVTELGQLGDTAELVRTMLVRRRAILCQLIAEGQRDGSISALERPEDVADALLALFSGMRLLGKAQLFPKDHEAFVGLALKLLG
ncbi:TetR family transcriptional regulator [Bradyrhizobium sp. CSA207]|uniref:TetR/AcrR family transcriptional regulator n=1 Tax=Bradyrhizobium sp. CSA207 TaxID=2698826 RepID=UPI0023B12F1F|nr:TetR/AcrR family transcriptional regulator [Bradyrhizobium sp. CSA207]MDE5446333.1 TetR family transcriptional regulator [Bradyrhizobium sp. CSA207]